jgi:hypothetical protein
MWMFFMHFLESAQCVGYFLVISNKTIVKQKLQYSLTTRIQLVVLEKS